MKKIMTAAVTFAVALTLIGTAQAETYTVNMCGASAQAGFWEKAGATVVKDSFTCDSAVLDGADDSLIIRGLNCTATTGSDGTDTIYVRYNAVSSSYGCKNYDCTETDGWADPDNCDFDGNFNCGTESAMCQLGCADVSCETITATSRGYYSGRAGYADEIVDGDSLLEDDDTEKYTSYGNAGGYAIDADTTWNGVVVPFGFIANNGVQEYVCNYDNMPADYTLAYDKSGWSCDPTADVDACTGVYACLDTDEDGTGVCQDGSGRTCSDASDCEMASSETVSCDAQPLKNVTRLMVLHIFSNKVANWSEFGNSYVATPIVKCMRHGGSGTHQTLINTVFRGDETVYNRSSRGTQADESYVWHYKSSSTLTRDCVAYYDGAIGYVDADKVMYRSKVADNIHQLTYQGEGPNRLAVANGKYNFWAAQQCFMDETPAVEGCYGTNDVAYDILSAIMTKAGDPSYLTYSGFGQRAYFWATQDEMKVEKATEFAYPSRTEN